MEIPRCLIRLVPSLQKNFLCALHSRSLMEGRVLFNLQGFATRYPLRGLPAPPQGNPLPPFTIQNVDAGWGFYCYNVNSCSMQNPANGMDSVGQGPRLLQIECIATQFRAAETRAEASTMRRWRVVWKAHVPLCARRPAICRNADTRFTQVLGASGITVFCSA